MTRLQPRRRPQTAGAAIASALILAIALLTGPLGAGPARAAESAALVDALQARFELESSLPHSEDGRKELLAMREFYDGRGFGPAWVGGTGATDSGATDRGKTLAGIIATSDLDGLLPANYGADELLALLPAQSVEDLVELEFRLTRSLLHYGRDLSAGRVQPNKVDSEVFIYPDPVESLKLLTTAAASADLEGYLAGFAPQSKNYARLKASLADHREIAARGGWSRLPDGETLKPGMTDPQVALLRKRLVEAGDLDPAQAEGELFDATLETAVKRFQYRHGLEQDAAVGKNTRAALNTPVEARIEQMLLNMERRRWMPDDLGERYVFVNLADFVLKVVDGPKTIYDSRVVVGKPYHRTPVFTGEMTYVVINPFWHVPPSIARNEILPAVQKNPGYLAQKNFTVFSSWGANAAVLDPSKINWNGISKRNLTYKFRQGSGDGNALGRIKFMFPNQFNVYLHDTPAKSLFARAVRSFSHGCIRVEDPPGLAEVVLKGQDGWTLEKIKGAIDSEKRQTVNLDRSMPVHLTYLTAWVNKDGSVHFRDDIYDRDKRLRAALERSHVTGTLGQ